MDGLYLEFTGLGNTQIMFRGVGDKVAIVVGDGNVVRRVFGTAVGLWVGVFIISRCNGRGGWEESG